MPKTGDNYGLVITVQPVEILEDGSSKKLGTTTQDYAGFTYEQLVTTQKVATIALVEALTGIGLAIAEEMKKGAK